ncbi:MAG: glycosyltransferase family 4 protein [Rhizobiaceae bacterium]|nr:glycosyltransferase family 4 protein [Rhizobiaceae bacterium]
MKIGWVTPLARASAIGRVSAIVCDALAARGHDVEIIRCEMPEFVATESHATSCKVTSIHDVPAEVAAERLDGVFLNIGDNFNFHGGVFNYLHSPFAIGIIHDFYLFNLFNGWREHLKLPVSRASQEIVSTYGPAFADAALRAIHGEMTTTEIARSIPMAEWVARRCNGAIAHAKFYMPRLRAACGGVVDVANLPWPGRDIAEPVSTDGKLTIVTVGVVNPNKCADLVIDALGRSDMLRNRLRYVLAGPIDTAMRQQLETSAVEKGVEFEALGSVTDEQLAEVLSNSDVMCCLRRPVLEGASASVIEGMLSGRPTVVVDDGFYGELPDEYVVKVPPAFDSSDLARVLERLMSVSAEQRLARGREAKAWASEEFSVDRYVEVIERVLREQIRMGPYLDLADQVVARLNWLGIDSSGASAARFAGAIDSMRRFDAPSPHKI